jgi:hypothetical protein
MALALPHIAFPDVFNGPHRSHVGVMKALGYVLGVRQIKAGAWPDMIDVPFAASSAVITFATLPPNPSSSSPVWIPRALHIA